MRMILDFFERGRAAWVKRNADLVAELKWVRDYLAANPEDWHTAFDALVEKHRRALAPVLEALRRQGTPQTPFWERPAEASGVWPPDRNAGRIIEPADTDEYLAAALAEFWAEIFPAVFAQMSRAFFREGVKAGVWKHAIIHKGEGAEIFYPAYLTGDLFPNLATFVFLPGADRPTTYDWFAKWKERGKP